MSKHYFFGKYYKCVSPEGFAFALIDSYADDGKAKQLIFPFGSYDIHDLDGIQVKDDGIDFDLHEEGLTVEGSLRFTNLHPLKHSAMGPFRLFSMECSHDIYSMYHDVDGDILINGDHFSFNGGYGYIEGDKGHSFPSRYTWYNSVGKDYGVTVALATIPFGLIHFTGILGFVSYQGKEYRLCTYNGVKVKAHTKDEIHLKRGKYEIIVHITENEGKPLKAPTAGNMNRIIKENVAVKTTVTFRIKGRTVFEHTDACSSVEQMF